ncbi:unnamed protein product [Urochloa humidicola]
MRPNPPPPRAQILLSQSSPHALASSRIDVPRACCSESPSAASSHLRSLLLRRIQTASSTTTPHSADPAPASKPPASMTSSVAGPAPTTPPRLDSSTSRAPPARLQSCRRAATRPQLDAAGLTPITPRPQQHYCMTLPPCCLVCGFSY